jgi:hypothetical protein
MSNANFPEPEFEDEDLDECEDEESDDEESEDEECDGHPAGPFDAMGVTVYCDGSCRT